MPALLVIGTPGPGWAVLTDRLQAAGFGCLFSADTAAALDALAAPDAPGFVLAGPDLGTEAVLTFLDALKAHPTKALPILGCRPPLDAERLLSCSRRLNHFILDLDDAVIVDKKLSNLKSITRLVEGKQAFRELEQTLQAESQKLVDLNVNNVRLLADVSTKNKRLELAERDIKNLLENLGQGFFTVDREGRVQDGYTEAVKGLFGREPHGLTLWELLGLDDQGGATARKWLEIAFADTIPFEDLVPLGETEFRGAGRYVALEYRQIRDPGGAVEKLIVIATDRTLEKRYEEKSRRKEAFAKVILRVVKDRAGFLDFLDECRRLLAGLETAFAPDSRHPDLAECYRAAHTLKGNASAFGMPELAEQAHRFEDALDAHRADALDADLPVAARAQLAEMVAAARRAFDAAVASIEQAVGGISDTVATRMTLDKAGFEQFESGLLAASGGNAQLLDLFYDTFYHSNFYKHLLRYGPVVKDIAARLGKKARLKVISQPVRVYAAPYTAFIQSLVHLVRNSLDHGIETPEERIAQGKPEESVLVVHVTMVDGGRRMRVAFRDDGRGIDAERVRAKAVEQGLVGEREAAALPDGEALRYVFRSGFTTRDTADAWSGRGVGMDAVARAAEALGGTVELETRKGEYTEVACTLPLLRKNRESRGGS